MLRKGGTGALRVRTWHVATCALPSYRFKERITMKLSKLLLAVVGATVLLGALVVSASAGRLEDSSVNNRVVWSRVIFRGGIGNSECEARVEGRFHTRSITKTAGSLVGYITAATIIRCARGGGTVNQASLPWHRRYRAFSGTLPRIATVEETITGAEWRVREPTFGITCTVRAAESSTIFTAVLSSGTVTSVSVSGSSNCEGLEGSLEGATTNADNGAGARITITLI
jgi:hypothetical protein